MNNNIINDLLKNIKSYQNKSEINIIEKAIEFASKVKVAGHLKLAGALVRANIFDHVTPLTCPGMIIAGSDDRSAPPQFVKEIADAYPGIVHHTIDGIGHQIALEKPDTFVGLLCDHLNAAEGTGTLVG